MQPHPPPAIKSKRVIVSAGSSPSSAASQSYQAKQPRPNSATGAPSSSASGSSAASKPVEEGETKSRPKTPAGSGIHAAAAISKKSLLSKTFTPKYILGTEAKAAPGSEVFCVRYSPDAKYLAASCGDSNIKIYNANTGAAEFTLLSDATVPLPSTCARWRPLTQSNKTPILLTADAGGYVSHWNIHSRKLINKIHQPGNQVFALDYKDDGTAFATAGYDRLVRIYDDETKAEIRALGGGFAFGGRFKTGHSNRVFSLKFCDNILLSGGWDNTIQIWDMRDIHPVRSIFGPHICGDSLDIRGNTLLTGSWRLELPLQIWDLPSGKLLRDIPFSLSDNNCCIYACQFSKDETFSRICAGGSGAHEARLFETHSGDVVGRISGMSQGVYSVDFHPTLNQVAVGSGDGTVRIVDFQK